MKQDINKNIVPFTGIKQYFPALNKAVSAKRLFVTSVLFVPLLSFGGVYKDSGGLCYSPTSLTLAGSDGSWASTASFYKSTYNVTIVDGEILPAINAPYSSCIFSKSWIPMKNGSGFISYCANVPNPIVSCPTCSDGSTWNGTTQTCVFPPPPPLNTFDNDPQGCSKAGGYFMSTGTEQVGGTTYGASFFGGAGIQLGGSLKATTKCGTLGDLAGQLVTTALSLVPFASKLFGSDGMKKLSNLAWVDKLQKYNQSGGFADLPNTPKGFNDTSVGLPRVNPTAGGKPSVPITESAVPSAIKSGDTSPSATRAPQINVDPAYQFIQNAHIPTKSNGDVVWDSALVDTIYQHNNLSREHAKLYQSDPVKYSYLAPASVKNPTPLTEVIPKTFTYTAPVKDTVDFSKIVSGGYTPINIGNYTGQTNLVHTVEGTTPIDTYTTVKNFPDGSKSTQVLRIVPSTNSGSLKTTTLSYEGISNTTTVPIQTVGYVSPTTQTVPSNVTIHIVDDSPITSTNSTPATPITHTNPDSTTTTVYPDGSTITKDATGTTISSTPATVTTPANTLQGQDASTIIDATMPDYSFNENSSFVDFVTKPVSDMVDDTSLMFSNISNQLASAKSSFDNTKALLDGSFTPPTFPQGSCGSGMAFDIWGKHVDFCPPLVNATAKVSPLVEPVVAISGTVISVVIIFGGI